MDDPSRLGTLVLSLSGRGSAKSPDSFAFSLQNTAERVIKVDQVLAQAMANIKRFIDDASGRLVTG